MYCEGKDYKLIKSWEFNEVGDMRTLHCLVIPKQRDILSIRDLTSVHLPMLKAMRDESLNFIHRRFGVPPQLIRAFVHYLPTFFHLHVHLIHT